MLDDIQGQQGKGGATPPKSIDKIRSGVNQMIEQQLSQPPEP